MLKALLKKIKVRLINPLEKIDMIINKELQKMVNHQKHFIKCLIDIMIERF